MAAVPFAIDVESGAYASSERRDFEAVFARQALMLVRRRLGTQALKDLPQEEIAAADEYWKKMSAESDGKFRPSRVAVSKRGLTTKDFFTCFIPNGYMVTEEKIAAHPEHRVVQGKPGPREIYVLETVGDKVSQFTMVDDGNAAGFVTNDPNYPTKMTGRLIMEGGIQIGEVYHQFKDHEDGKGFDADLAIYFPAACDDDLIDCHRQHLLVEFSNWFEDAYKRAARRT
ncbi:uncharacterized protein ALTATR162_LOCUS143 [Alternaria atra]|uniref:Uncharacterized protein n=1 Tax=Alternaria atra TaxID=119953 RepID=A0A8J2HSQ6_9PLEO|nr:uncharacterized protein ALTATR162_LOCUS143 [Alternaria atra]CAG5137547.1 unnamed protein product [Alternaria atra]